MASVHEGKKPFKCSICATRFSRKTHLNAHLEQLKRIESFKCNICDANRKFFNKNLLFFSTKSKRKLNRTEGYLRSPIINC